MVYMSHHLLFRFSIIPGFSRRIVNFFSPRSIIIVVTLGICDQVCLNGEEDDQDADGKDGDAGYNKRHLKNSRLHRWLENTFLFFTFPNFYIVSFHTETVHTLCSTDYLPY